MSRPATLYFEAVGRLLATMDVTDAAGSAMSIDVATDDVVQSILRTRSAARKILLLYLEWARAIAGGDLLGPAEPFHHPPLYPYLLGVLELATGGAGPIAAYGVQTVLGLATTALAYVLARRVATRPIALGVVALSILHLPPTFFESRLLPTTLALFLAAAGLVALGTPRGGFGSRLWAGALLGLLAAARPNQLLAAALVLPAAAAIGAVGLRDAARRLLPLALGAALSILPFAARNLLHAGEPVLLCDTGGINLHFAHHDGAGVSFRTDDPRFGDVASQPAVARRIAEQAEGRALSSREVSSHFSRRALAWAVEHPAREAELLAGRFLAFLSNFEYGIVFTPAAERHLVRTTALLPVPAGLLLALATLGILLIERRRPETRPTVVAALFVGAQLATVLLFFEYSRFRVVALPAVVLLGAYGATRLTELLAAGRRVRAGIGVGGAAIVLAASFLPPPDEADEQRAAAHTSFAAGFFAEGDVDAARAEIDRALRLRPDFARAHLVRTRGLRGAGLAAEALDGLERAAAAYGTVPLLRAERALTLLRAEVRDLPRAIAEATAALEADPTLLPAVEALAGAHLLAGDAAAAAEALTPLPRLPDASARLWALFAEALRRSGRPSEAAAAMERARTLDPGIRPPGG